MLNNLKNAAINTVDRLVYPEKLVATANTPYQLIHQEENFSVRWYGAGQPPAKYSVPLVIIPPMAVNTLIYDWFPDRSLVKYLLAAGYDVYMIDWGSPGRRQARLGLRHYVADFIPRAIARVRANSGSQEVSLHGWSMGAGFALCYSMHSKDPGVKNLVLLGAPINARANGEMGKLYGNFGKQLKRLGVNVSKIPGRWLYSPAWMNAIGFKIMDPVSSMQGYVDLIRNIHDREFVSNQATMSAFLDKLEAYPGGVIRDWTATLWFDNDPGERGYFRIGREKLYLKDIEANVLSIAGTKDLLATVSACEALMDKISSKDKAFVTFPDGHTGIVSGRGAPTTVWPKVAEWLSERSG